MHRRMHRDVIQNHRVDHIDWSLRTHSCEQTNISHSAPEENPPSWWMPRLFLFYLVPNAYVNTTENNIQAIIIINGKSDSNIDMSKFPLNDLDTSWELYDPNSMKCRRLFFNSVLLLIECASNHQSWIGPTIFSKRQTAHCHGTYFPFLFIFSVYFRHICRRRRLNGNPLYCLLSIRHHWKLVYKKGFEITNHVSLHCWRCFLFQ